MIKILCVGKIKESYLDELINDYKKRIGKYIKIEIIELKDESTGNILEKEANSIKKYIDSKDYIITLEIEGNMLDSVTLSQKIEKTFLNYPNITFIIGGSYGLSNEIKQMSNYKLSFSKQTFPHQLFRVMLLEQVYRSFKIINNETYHK